MLTILQGMGSEDPAIRLADTEIGVIKLPSHLIISTGVGWIVQVGTGLGNKHETRKRS